MNRDHRGSPCVMIDIAGTAVVFRNAVKQTVILEALPDDRSISPNWTRNDQQ
jgi:hypothetical protein